MLNDMLIFPEKSQKQYGIIFTIAINFYINQIISALMLDEESHSQLLYWSRLSHIFLKALVTPSIKFVAHNLNTLPGLISHSNLHGMITSFLCTEHLIGKNTVMRKQSEA